MTQFGRQADLVPGHGAGNAAGNDLHRGRRADRAPGAADVRPAARTCLNGPQSEAAAPPDLLAWLRAQSVADAAQALGLSRRTVYRLQGGYWPADARKVAAAWATYRGRTGRVESSWFLRRVRAGGVVPHAGRRWSGVGLQQHVGELVAVARMPDGALLAQTLELPAERLPLEALP